MTNSEKLLHLAGKIEQIHQELGAMGKDRSIPLGASHECGVIQCHLAVVTKKLTSLAQKLGS